MMRFFTLVLFVSLVGSINAQEYIWGGPGEANSEFDGGINDWTTVGVSPNAEAVFIWEADGIADNGNFFGTRGPINSPSVANGAMVFDSDFYDNAGMDNNFGNGIAPARQLGELISPVIDCSNQDQVSVLWYQYMRQFTSDFRLEVTNDGGVNWVPFEIQVNSEWDINTETPDDMRVVINISDVAANQSEVQFKFVYDANYYFWVIDDVSLIVTPETNMKVTNIYYTPPAAVMPQTFIEGDTLDFAAEIANIGTAENAGSTITAEILETDGAVVYTFTEDLPTTAFQDTTFFILESQVYPEDLNLFPGQYLISYSIETVAEDFIEYDNVFSIPFEITNDRYSTTDNITNANGFQGEHYPGITFRTGSVPDGMAYRADSIAIGGFGDQVTGMIANAEAGIFLFELKNQLSDELDPLFTAAGSGTPQAEHDNLELVGFGFLTQSNADNFDLMPSIELIDSDGADELILKENTTYIAALDWNDDVAGNAGFTTTSQDIFYHQRTNLVYIEDDNQWFTLGGGVDAVIAWAMPLVISTVSTVANEETELEDNAVAVFPNPAVDFTVVDLNFNEATSASIVLTDSQGRYLSSKSVENVKNSKVEFSTENLPAGNYAFKITTTNNEVSTKTFIVVK